MVYPESNEAEEEDNDRTSISSAGEINQLVGQMDQKLRAAAAAGQSPAGQSQGAQEKLRAMEAQRQESGDPFDNDGTVEIQNPMAMWKEAQAAMAAAKADSLGEESSEDLELKTEIADPASFGLPSGNRPSQLAEQSDPTFMMPANPLAEMEARSSGMGSGAHPYAQNTPPDGRAQGPGALPNGAGSNTGSGLNSADLFQDTGGGGAGPDPNHPGPWKLKTGFGLTYEFPDTKSLRNWLSSREDLDGYSVSGDDGASFFSLDHFPQLDRQANRPMMPSGNFSMPPSGGSGLNPQPRGADASGSGLNRAPGFQSGSNQPSALPPAFSQSTRPPNPQATQRGALVSTEFKPPSRENKYRGALWLVFFLLLLIAVGIGLQTFGVVDILGTSKPAPNANVGGGNQAIAPAPAEVDTDALAARQLAETERLIEDARREMEANKLQSALDKLNTTVAVNPGSAEAYELLADVHARLGQADESASAEAKAKELRASEAPEAAAASPDAGQPTK